jgi:hypothetical protein
MKLEGLVCGGLVMIASTGARADSNDGDTKSAAVATTLAIGGSLVGPALVVTAIKNDGYQDPLHDEFVPLIVSGAVVMVLGPSLGNWYAHEGWSTGLGLRLAGSLSFGIGTSVLAAGLFKQGHTGSDIVGAVLTLSGMATFVAGTVCDVVQAHRSVGTYNHEHAAQRLSIAPTVTRADGVQRTGFAIVGTF